MKEAIRGPITDHLKLLENFVQDNGFLVGDDVSSSLVVYFRF